MKPRPNACDDLQGDMFRTELASIINLEHPLALLAGRIDWGWFERELGASFCPDNGAPAKPVRLMVGLHYLKHVYNLSDEQTVARWVENPYWQHFCGMKWFEHTAPIDPSSMTRWRKLLGKRGVEALLEESIRAGLRTGTIKPASLDKINVDTTVQEKAVAHPTDARLLARMRERLVALAGRLGVKLRQSFRRLGGRALVAVGRLGCRGHLGALRKEVGKLHRMLRHVLIDLTRRTMHEPGLFAQVREELAKAGALLEQMRGGTGRSRLYSVHAPEVECIGKGKLRKRYEFGCKVGLVATSREGFMLGAQALHGNPYDGHTLRSCLEQAGRLAGRRIEGDVFVDLGYRKHDYLGAARVHVGQSKKGKERGLHRWIKRRAAIEPSIGHMKTDGRLGRNHLLGKVGDHQNAVLSAAGHNLRLILNRLKAGKGAGRLFLCLPTLLAGWLAAARGWPSACVELVGLPGPARCGIKPGSDHQAWPACQAA